MRISGTLPFSMNNGHGFRYVIFTQGCIHKCKDCHNKHTWDFNGGVELSVDELMNDISKRKHIDGITISGGEPFLQQDECVELINRLPEGLDVWVYTGFLYEEIKHTLLTSVVDYIVDGKFDKDDIIYGKMYGSGNQRVIDVGSGMVVL